MKTDEGVAFFFFFSKTENVDFSFKLKKISSQTIISRIVDIPFIL